MNDQPVDLGTDHVAPRKPRQRKMRTFSAFGDVRRLPSEYEVVTHAQNWNTRANKSSVFEQNPSSPGNLWFLTYREHSPLSAPDWEGFRDPDKIAYRSYVNLQATEQTKLDGVLEQYADADRTLDPDQVTRLGMVMTPSRYLVHGFQQAEAYIGFIGPTSYVTSAAGYANADFLRRVTTIAYRTRSLQLAHPTSGIGTDERRLWETHPAWQPAREAIERALIAYDWGESFTSLNAVLAPTLDDFLLRQLGDVSRAAGDEQTWLVSSLLRADSARRDRWSAALVRYALEQRPGNEKPLRKWIDRWSERADEAVAALAPFLGRSTDDALAGVRESRAALHALMFDESTTPARAIGE
ncbi:toluene hydroxylase [Rudaeicoccus suwonensis]|uniref:propane 2-monooxygenase n=1 Tax=Rudaeicoccus suwonensis TaxID=657409 RepID=A0A561E302_9MICO|nr:toluene hydroxylase [Rudaeicoccus suwonensis]TWE09982.1 toluene 4-monooxygenase protein E [Rudaeicoccus suwonensis]